MSEINNILKMVKLPTVYKVRQEFRKDKIENIEKELIKKLNEKNSGINIKPHQRIAITAGSRGISNYSNLLKIIVDFIKNKGAVPFIVPAMGSHGGGTASGQ